jgi:hypothetical protein
MQTFDWLNWAALVAVGVMLGLVIDGMVDLAETGSWRSIIIILVVFGCWCIFYLLLERLFNFIFIGRLSAPKQLQKPRKPLALLFALPIGIIIGVIGAQFGLGELLL